MECWSNRETLSYRIANTQSIFAEHRYWHKKYVKIIRYTALRPLGNIPGNATVKSKLEAVTGMHYRNLFPHKLWLTRAYLSICISGHMIKIGHLVLVSTHQRSASPACAFLMTDHTTMGIMKGWAGHLQAKIPDTFLLYFISLAYSFTSQRPPWNNKETHRSINEIKQGKQLVLGKVSRSLCRSPI